MRRRGGRYGAGVLDVTPRMTQADVPSVFGGHAISRPQFGECKTANGVVFPKGYNGLGCVSCQRGFSTSGVPTLGHSILHVFGMGSGKNVGRVAARRIVAGVTSFKAIGEWLTLRIGVGHLVRVIVDAFVAKRAITEPRSRTLPLPTIGWPALVDLVPDGAGQRAMGLARVGIRKWLFAAPTDKVSAFLAHDDDCSDRRNCRQAEVGYA